MKRIISFLLCLTLLFSMLPMEVFAGEVSLPEQTEPVPETTAIPQTTASTEVPETESTYTPETEPTGATQPSAEAPTEAATLPQETEIPTLPEETEPSSEQIAATEEALAESEEEVILSDLIHATLPEGPSSEELFAGYVEQQFYGGFSTFGIAAGSLLTGDTKLVYDAVVPLIRKIAAGDLDRAVMTVGPSSATAITTEPFSGSEFTGEQLNALLDALLADLPYEMYWMDKTEGVAAGYSITGGKMSKLTLYFSVADAYRNTGNGKDIYDLDTTKTRAATVSAANARQIVLDYAGASDYEKLLNFKNTICSLVSYNRSAASNSSTPYGDPWQLIYVFDGDPNTNVVCEGYSKAFQYLCDLSTFHADVVCHSVTGTIPGGGHMWNIVSVEGKNYLADITNSDSGTVGASGGLFLVGGSGSIKAGYRFLGTLFTYDPDAISFWGDGPDSILLLDTKDLTADNFPSSAMEDFKKMLEGDGSVVLSTALTLTENITISRDIVIAEGGSLIVPKGITLTIPAEVTLTNQGTLQVQNGGAMTVTGGIFGNLPQLDAGSTVSGDGSLTIDGVTTAETLVKLLNTSHPYGSVTIPIRTAMTLGTNVTIPANVALQVTNAKITVAAAVTLTNQGIIRLGSGASLVIRKGGKLTGNPPLLISLDAVFEDLNILTQAALEEMLESQTEITMDQSLTLTNDLTVPAGKTLTITGKDIFLRIPAGKTLKNLGKIECLSEGGIQGTGGTLNNQGTIHTRQWGILDMPPGSTYEAGADAMVYNEHFVNKDGSVVNSTVRLPASSITVTVDGFNEAQLRDILNHLNTAPPAALTFQVSRNLSLTEDLTWPSYGTMTIPEGVTLTVAQGARVSSEGTILLSGQILLRGAMDTDLRPIRVMRTLPSGLDEARREAYIRENILRTSGDLPAFVFPGTAPTRLNPDLPSGQGTAEDPVCTGIGSAVSIGMLPASPLGADVMEYYYAFQIVSGEGQLLADLYGDGYQPYEGEVYYGSRVQVRSDTAGQVVLRVTPRNTLFEAYGPEYARDIVISFLKKHLEVTVTGDSLSQSGTDYELWAGSALTLTPRLVKENGTDADGTIFCSIDGGEAKDCTGGLTVTAPDSLTALKTARYTFTAEGVDPVTVTIRMRPVAASLDLVCSGETVTGQTIPVDLDRGIQSLSLSAVVSPADAFLEGSERLSWTTSDENIAAVDGLGQVTFSGRKTGLVTITLTADYGVTKTASVTFDVVDLSKTIISHKGNPTALIGGGKATFLAVNAATGQTLDSDDLSWFLCDEAGVPMEDHPYADITESGKLTTKAVADPYTVCLMVQVLEEGNPAWMLEPVTVTLYPAITSAVILDPDGEPISGTALYDPGVSGKTFSLGRTVAPYPESVKSVAWKSSSEKIAKIDPKGKVTVLGNGTVTFTLTVTDLNGKKTNATAKIKFAAYTRSLTITPAEAVTLSSGESLTFTAVSDPASVTTPGYSWKLSHKNAGSISSKGVFKAKTVVNPTEVLLTAVSKDGNCVSDPIAITVLPKAGSLVIYQVDGAGNVIRGLTKTTQTLAVGDKLRLAANGDVDWTSSKPSVATVDGNGNLVAKGNGSATITAKTADDRKATFTLKVSKMSKAVKVSVKNGAAASVASGKTLSLVGTVTYNDGSTDTKVSWTLADTSLATLSSSGKLAAAKKLTGGGTVYVTATAKDGRAVSQPFPIAIHPVSTALEIHGPFSRLGTSMDVTNTTQRLDLNTRTGFTLSARVFPSGSREDVTWKSSSAKIATIDASGKVRCLKPGTVTFTATARDGSGKKASFKVTVLKAAAYVSLPETAFVGGGKSLTMTKLEGFRVDPDATNKKLSWSMTMVSGNAEKPVPGTVATLSSSGVLKTKAVVSPVELRIRARTTDGSNRSAMCTVTVYPVIKGVTIRNTAGTDLTRKTVSLKAGSSYVLCPDTTNSKTSYGPMDDGTADEYMSAKDAWTITASNVNLKWDASVTGRITVTAPRNLAGKTVKLTLKANDGSGKSAYLSFKIT